MLSKYDHYSEPRLTVWNGEIYMIRDVLSEAGRPSGVCENATGFDDDGNVEWRFCHEGVEFSKIAPFLSSKCLYQAEKIDQEKIRVALEIEERMRVEALEKGEGK